jgi:hypothetical protein
MKLEKRTFFIYESVLVLLIILSPYFLYINLHIPEDLKKYDTFFGTIEAGYFETIQNYVYWIFSKLVPLFLLSILYLTHKKWWSHAMIIPIATYLFQLISVINDSSDFLDGSEFIYTIPIMVVVIVPLFLLRKKLSVYISAIDLKKEMDEIIERTD